MTLCAATALAASITGVVTNRTTGKPSAGDTVAVINTAQSMDEIVKVTSDSSGKFHVNAPDGGQILLHVTHAGAEYFKSVPPGTANVDIDVYDSAAKIDGITGEALVLRAETDPSGKTLTLAENFFVQNASAPPRTEYGGNTFDFYLPKGAKISQSLASAPNGLPTNTDVKTIDAATGHYAFTFPIRPGETRFQVAYSLPYNGKQPFSIKLSVPTGDVAVMLPKSMQFQGSAQFQPLNTESAGGNSQSFDAHEPSFTQPIQFTLAGTGQLPETPDTTHANGGPSGNGAQPAEAGTAGSRPGGGLGAPIDPEATNDPWAKYKWWILSVLGLALVIGAAVMLKRAPAPADGGLAPLPYAHGQAPTTSGAFVPSVAATPASVAAAAPGSMLSALKDELFELETDRLAGRLTDTQYAEHKAAFDVVLRRALARIEVAPAASND
jgi:hypothetical protein